jgi:hypothetical protein
MDSGTGITGGGSGYAALLAHAGGDLYGTELGSVTLNRVGLFCFPIKHSTHTPLKINTHHTHPANLPVCVECLIGKQKKCSDRVGFRVSFWIGSDRPIGGISESNTKST